MMRVTRLLVALLVLLPAAATALSGGEDVEARIRNALSAAPPAVAEIATVAEHDGAILREGSSDWVCLPDLQDVPNNAPMCLDATWREVIAAWQDRREPEITAVGISYMLQGDMPVSNTDPFAEGPTAHNEWIAEGPPHIMIVVPDAAQLDHLPTDPTNGGPWVMWKGTPYAHVMIPTVPRR